MRSHIDGCGGGPLLGKIGAWTFRGIAYAGAFIAAGYAAKCLAQRGNEVVERFAPQLMDAGNPRGDQIRETITIGSELLTASPQSMAEGGLRTAGVRVSRVIFAGMSEEAKREVTLATVEPAHRIAITGSAPMVTADLTSYAAAYSNGVEAIANAIETALTAVPGW